MDSLQKMPVADRLRRVGSTDQLYSVTRVTVDEGKARGTAMYQVKTGGGLSYEVTADNGLDIGCLRYRGVNVSFLAKNGYVSPYGSHPFEEDFTHTFTGGMLYTWKVPVPRIQCIMLPIPCQARGGRRKQK